MIPADVASRLQVSADTALRPVAPAQEIADRLSGLVADKKKRQQSQAQAAAGMRIRGDGFHDVTFRVVRIIKAPMALVTCLGV